MPRTTLPRRLAALVAVAAAALALAGCATLSSQASDRASGQALERLRAAPELPIDEVIFTVGPGRWVDAGATPVPLDEARVAEVLWSESITQIDSVAVDTVHTSGGDDVVRFDRRKLEEWYGPRPNGLVTIT